MANLTRDLIVNILADTTKLNQGIDGVNQKMGAWSRGMKVAGAAAGAALIAAPVVEFLGDSAQAAEEDKKAQEELARQLKVSTGATDAQVAAVEESIRALSLATGVADDDLRPAYEALARSTGDTEKANAQLALAMDISAARGVDLTTVTAAMEKANNGNTSALGRMGIATKDAEGNTLSLEQVMANATKTYEGAAEAAVTPAQRMSVAWAEMQEQIGTALLPVLENLSKFMADTLLPAVQEVVVWIQDHWPEIQKTIQKVVDVVKPVLEGLFAFVKIQFEVITGVIDAFVNLLHGDFSGAWEAIKGVVEGVWDGIRTACESGVEFVKQTFGGLITWIGSLPAQVAGAAEKLWQPIWGAFKSVINRIIGGWNWLADRLHIEFKAPDWMPGIGGKGFEFGLPHFEPLAKGGIVNRPTFALIGEAGPEAVIPLGRGAPPMPGIVMNNVTVVANNPEQLIAAINDYARRNGGVRLSGGVTAVS